ncbi:hypothetical protein DY000_02039479 [Brassica cretica]|uniref:RRM domain-containing protein n=1 Tax=Brassica cretica TaxID=69181 RepID=A0ABQ7BMF1_BRACR|nr:hypothetical protein DY000_02039479 [Brassica cretica]
MPFVNGTGCKAECLDTAGRVSGGTGRGRGVNFVTLAKSSLTRHVALPDHGVRLDGVKTLKWREFEAKPKPEAKEETVSEGLDSGMDWTNGEEQDFVGKGLHQYLRKRKIKKDLRNLDKDDIYRKDTIVSWARRVLWQSKSKRTISDHSSEEI